MGGCTVASQSPQPKHSQTPVPSTQAATLPAQARSTPDLTSAVQTDPTYTSTSTATQTPDVTATRTPLPTLSPDEAEAFVMDLMANNAGCELPCWWGVIPGETSWDEVEPFFETFATDISRGDLSRLPGYYFLHYRIPGQLFDGTTGIATSNHLIKEIGVSRDGTGIRYQLHQLLSSYGEPDEVWVQGWPFNDAREPYYALLVIYSKLGIMARYEGNPSPKYLVSMRICPQEISPELELWDPDREDRSEFVKAQVEHENIVWAAPEFRPLEEVTDLDTRDFYEIMQSYDGCFETPTHLWDNREY
jgi:hypothetical protein